MHIGLLNKCVNCMLIAETKFGWFKKKNPLASTVLVSVIHVGNLDTRTDSIKM